jgi:hypothetical protein
LSITWTQQRGTVVVPIAFVGRPLRLEMRAPAVARARIQLFPDSAWTPAAPGGVTRVRAGKLLEDVERLVADAAGWTPYSAAETAGWQLDKSATAADRGTASASFAFRARTGDRPWAVVEQMSRRDRAALHLVRKQDVTPTPGAPERSTVWRLLCGRAVLVEYDGAWEVQRTLDVLVDVTAR